MSPAAAVSSASPSSNNSSPTATKSALSSAAISGTHKIESATANVRGDLLDPNVLADATKNIDAVFHVAAKPGVWGTYKDFYEPNVIGTQNIVAACKLHNVPRLIFTSSPSVVFTGGDENNISESAPYPKRYLAHYPKTKAIAEQLVLAANSPTLATIALRPHLIWGPGDPHLVPRILARARAGRLSMIGKTQKPR